jgi:hypothetical protein
VIPRLPSYSSPSTPTYSSEPSSDEQSLDHTPAINQPIPTSTYTKADDYFTLTSTRQVSGAVIPAYGRNGLVRGLRDCAEVIAVNMKVSEKVFYLSK